MQFYETLPNFIYDWIDTSMIVKDLNLPKFMSMETELGMMIDFKWLYNINSGFIILAVVFVSWLIKKSRITEGLIIGLCFSTLGLLISGWSQYGYIAVSGMLIYTLGEMITNPKFSEYMAKIAPSNQKSTYMGFINLSMALGLGLGSLIGGYLYNNYAEKSSLAKDFILNNYKLTENISHQNSVSKLMELKGLSYHHTTEFLWNTYNPQYIWLVFLFIGFASIISLYLYSRKFDKNT
jgi:MFS family permease